jgi:S-adenosylmethionine hydrolase
VITLTTDFGLSNWFVGTMKGVIAGIAPEAQVIDVCHEVPPGDIRAAAFVLAASLPFFPEGSIHVAVVDPGVGSARRPIAIRTNRAIYVGPDNGIFAAALKTESVAEIRELTNARYFLPTLSATFHGRDLFAPVAAHLSRGVPMSKLGPKKDDLVCLDWPETSLSEGRVEGQVIYIDRFGNAITNIPAATLSNLGKPAQELHVWKGKKRLCGIAPFYAAVPRGQTLAVCGSTGCLEVSVNGGDARKVLGLRIGSRITVVALNPEA